jgi:hypothetical protein
LKFVAWGKQLTEDQYREVLAKYVGEQIHG